MPRTLLNTSILTLCIASLIKFDFATAQQPLTHELRGLWISETTNEGLTLANDLHGAWFGDALLVGQGKVVKLLDPATGKVKDEPSFTAHADPLQFAVASPNGDLVATIKSARVPRESSEVRLWDASDFSRLWSRRFPYGYVASAFFSKDGKQFLVVQDQVIHRFDVETGKTRPPLPLKSEEGQQRVAKSQCGRYLLLKKTETAAEVYDRVTESITVTLPMTKETLTPQSRATWMVNGDTQQSALILYNHDPPGGRPEDQPESWANYPVQRHFVFDHTKAELITEFPVEPLSLVSCGSFSPDGRYLVLAGPRPQVPKDYGDSPADLSDKPVSFTSGGHLLPGGRIAWTEYEIRYHYFKNAIRVYDLTTKKQVAEMHLQAFDATQVTFLNNHQFFLSGSTTDYYLSAEDPPKLPANVREWNRLLRGKWNSRPDKDAAKWIRFSGVLEVRELAER